MKTSNEPSTPARTASSCRCTPTPGFTGQDAFSFTVSDGRQRSNPGNIRIIVRPSNRSPTARILIDALLSFTPDFERPVLIACNWWNSCLKLDGSLSVAQDPCGQDNALAYWWFLEPEPVAFAVGAVVTNCLEVGIHTIILAVTDANGLAGMDTKTIEVVTAPLAIELLIAKVDESRLARKTKRELTATLRVALNHAKRERLRETQQALSAFEKKVRAQVAQGHPAEATQWIRWSQAVSEGIENCLKPARKPKDTDGKSSKGVGAG